uniref:Uncharacterized protein n=1 Tax=Anguilla anguilla TaxID=7936 RepID=A0A0E9TYY3_ANGAN
MLYVSCSSNPLTLRNRLTRLFSIYQAVKKSNPYLC